jgi:hemerythrin-like domain-containing protein
MGEMSMNKAIHGAFRRDLDRFVSALDRFTPGDRERAQQLGAAWANFDDQLTHHHEGEHEIAWPALESIGVSKDVIATMDAEHDTMAAALTDARAAMATFTASASRSDADAALGAMQKLREVTVAHLEHEEAELEDVYLSQKDSPQMKAMGRAFGRVSPARGGRFFAWVLDGASIDERAAVTSEVPGPVLSVMGGVFGRSYRKNIAPVWHA